MKLPGATNFSYARVLVLKKSRARYGSISEAKGDLV
jgi:hypothetical protein